MNLPVLLLIALPMCIAQFTIQGPSDGNRVAQGLKVDEEKGLEFINTPSSGQSSIQGATDGNSNYQIQGATDGHSNFHIQGATDGHSNFQIQGARDEGVGTYYQQAAPETFNVQGPSEGNVQGGYIQGTYDSIPSSEKSLQYNDPSGLRVNWRSYERQHRPEPQPGPQYSAPAPQPVPYRERAHVRPQPQPVPRQPSLPPARSFNDAPSHIKQLLQFQNQLPYTNIIPEPYRYENLIATQAGKQQQPQYQNVEQEVFTPEPRRPPPRGKQHSPARHRRQTRQQPPAEPPIKYNTNTPPLRVQEALKLQAQAPYTNIIPEQFRFNVEAAAQEQLQQVRAHYQKLAAEASHPRQKRQAQHPQLQPRPTAPVGPQPHYSNNNVPGFIQELIKLQSQIPYNILPNQVTIRPEKPYVPQPVQPAPAQQAQYQDLAQYQGQPKAYQDQPSEYNQVYANQAQQSQYQQYLQGQSGNGIRPVTEKQY